MFDQEAQSVFAAWDCLSILIFIATVCAQKHMLTTHNIKDLYPSREEGSLQLYECMLCKRNFLSQKKLDMHTRLVHQKSRRFQCQFPYCDYEAYYKCHIDRHLKVGYTVDNQTILAN